MRDWKIRHQQQDVLVIWLTDWTWKYSTVTASVWYNTTTPTRVLSGCAVALIDSHKDRSCVSGRVWSPQRAGVVLVVAEIGIRAPPPRLPSTVTLTNLRTVKINPKTAAILFTRKIRWRFDNHDHHFSSYSFICDMTERMDAITRRCTQKCNHHIT